MSSSLSPIHQIPIPPPISPNPNSTLYKQILAPHNILLLSRYMLRNFTATAHSNRSSDKWFGLNKHKLHMENFSRVPTWGDTLLAYNRWSIKWDAAQEQKYYGPRGHWKTTHHFIFSNCYFTLRTSTVRLFFRPCLFILPYTFCHSAIILFRTPNI